VLPSGDSATVEIHFTGRTEAARASNSMPSTCSISIPMGGSCG
jgi:hypothetical protein